MFVFQLIHEAFYLLKYKCLKCYFYSVKLAHVYKQVVILSKTAHFSHKIATETEKSYYSVWLH